MTLKTAIQILEYHQLWRTGKTDRMPYTPKELTQAMDMVIDAAKSILSVASPREADSQSASSVPPCP